MKTPMEVLVNAKLAMTDSPSTVGAWFAISVRDNEQAAQIAIQALEEAGYNIVDSSKLVNSNRGLETL